MSRCLSYLSESVALQYFKKLSCSESQYGQVRRSDVVQYLTHGYTKIHELLQANHEKRKHEINSL